jgi:hypothetical protein
MLSFGMLKAAPFISAKALRAAAVFLRMALDSISKGKGSCGILYAMIVKLFLHNKVGCFIMQILIYWIRIAQIHQHLQ